MFRKYYKSLNSQINPDGELFQITKNKMIAELKTTKSIKISKFFRLATVATCLVIAFISIFVLSDIYNYKTPQITDNPEQAQSGAVYHDIDISQIIRQQSSGELKFGFYFYQELQMLAKNETSIQNNNGVRWDDNIKFAKGDIESSLNITIKEPVLPDGDYTTKKSVLIDEATNKTIAYQTVYYFFDKDTMALKNSFGIFYFAINDFKSDEIEQMKNVTKTEEININENAFPLIPHACGYQLKET
jgi:uncharacterized protein YcfL